VAATDTILQAIQKLNGNVSGLVTGVSSVFGRTGAVSATSGDYNTSQVTENTNLYYTEARVSANTDVAANTAARHAAVTIGTANGLSLSTQALSLAAANTSTTGALTSTDWNTFNNKLSTATAASTYVPYTGATGNVNLGTNSLTAGVGSFASSGGDPTFSINHSSGSGIALNITKGGNGEGLYINKASGSGNAATIIGTLNATTLVKSGGTSSQFLKADGSVDSSTYLTTSAASSTYLPLAGGTLTGPLGGTSATFSGNMGIGNTSTDTFSGYSVLQVGGTNNGIIQTFDGSVKTALVSNATGFGLIGTRTNHSLLIMTNDTTRLTIGTTGAATFQTTGNNGIINIGGSSYYSQLETNAVLGGLKIKSVWGGANSGIIQFINGTSENVRMHIADGGNISIGSITPNIAGYGGRVLTIGGGAVGENAVELYGSVTTDETIGDFTCLNAASSDSDKRVTIIRSSRNGANNSAALLFFTKNAGSFGQRMTISAVGSVGINMAPSNNDGYLQINSYLGTLGDSSKRRSVTIFSSSAENSDRPGVILGYDTAGAGIIAAATQSAGQPLTFWTYNGSAWAEKYRITATGQSTFQHTQTNQDVIYAMNGSASPYGMNITFTAASPNNTTNNFIYLADSSGLKCRIVSNGSIYNSTGTYGTISDIKFKENIVDATPKLDDILKLKVRNFNLIGDETKQIGFVAQEFEQVFPNMVDASKDKETGEEYKAIKTSVLIPILVKAIQELEARIKQLENK
jgi:hypothetical protein